MSCFRAGETARAAGEAAREAAGLSCVCTILVGIIDLVERSRRVDATGRRASAGHWGSGAAAGVFVLDDCWVGGWVAVCGEEDVSLCCFAGEDVKW